MPDTIQALKQPAAYKKTEWVKERSWALKRMEKRCKTEAIILPEKEKEKKESVTTGNADVLPSGGIFR